MSEDPVDNPASGSQGQIALPEPKQKKRTFLRERYARVLNIRELNPDRGAVRVTKIPATLEASRARMMIVATKLLDLVEHKMNLMNDGLIILPSKDYKELVETLERAQKIMNDAHGMVLPSAKVQPPAPVSNSITINGACTPELDRMMQQVAAAALPKPPPIDVTPHDNRPDNGSS